MGLDPTSSTFSVNLVLQGDPIGYDISGVSDDLTDYVGYSGTAINVLRQAVTGITIHRDDTYFTGSSTAITTELRVGDDIIIDGSDATVTQILSATSFRINYDFTHTVSGVTVYKKKKIHGFVREGTREGAAAGERLHRARAEGQRRRGRSAARPLLAPLRRNAAGADAPPWRQAGALSAPHPSAADA